VIIAITRSDRIVIK